MEKRITLLAAVAGMMLLGACSSNSNSTDGSSGGASKPAFAPAQNDRFVVSTAELGAIAMDNHKYARWSFGLKLKQPAELRSVRVEDVTEGTAVLLINDQAPQPQGGLWSGSSGAIEPSAAAVPWLFQNTPSRRTFRFTVMDLNGQVSVLDQTVTYPVKSKQHLIKEYGFNA
jgi:hypothetical protein